MKKAHRFVKRLLLGLPWLFLTLGTAFANGKATISLPTPALTPPSGSTIQPGTKILFDIPDEAQSTGSVYVFYTVNSPDIPLETTYKELIASNEDQFQGLAFNVALAMADDNDVMNWTIPCVIMESGTVTLRARLAIAKPDENGSTDDNMSGSGDGTLTYSDIIEATYQVEGDIKRPDAPTFSPVPGALAAGGTIKLTSSYIDDPLHMTYYAIDGDHEIFEASTYGELMDLEDAGKITFYTSPISIDRPLTIKAVTFEVNAATMNVLRSDIIEATYWPDNCEEPEVTVAAPRFSPNGGTVAKNYRVKLTSATAGARIHYTTDGSEPTAQSTEYKGAITIDRDMTIKAVAFFGTKSVSAVTESSYTVTDSETPPLEPETPAETVAVPTFSVAGGEVERNTKVTISCATKGAKIYYTVDGSEPTRDNGNEYLTAVIIDKDLTLKAIAILGENASEVASASYTVKTTGGSEPENPADTVAAPTFSVPAGKVAFGTEVVIECATEGAEIYWSFGSNAPISKTEGTLYDGKPIILKFSGNLKAIAYYEGVESKPVSVRYTVGLSTPKFDLTPGAVPAGARVTITSESKEANPDKNYHIAYTVDGSEPSKDNGTEYTSPIEITEDVTIKAITWTMGVSGIEKSEVASASYTIETTGGDEPIVPDTVAVPTFSVPAGEVEKDTKVAIACATEGAKIYYTVDGSEPTVQSTEYKEAIVINEALTLKAIAVKEEMADSKVATAVYTVKDVANEELELAGVSVYPNPSNGVFNLELPVSATVEVFASNGVLRQRVEAGAGVVTLNIERSGIYFLRITGEGRTTVKRVVVR